MIDYIEQQECSIDEIKESICNYLKWNTEDVLMKIKEVRNVEYSYMGHGYPSIDIYLNDGRRIDFNIYFRGFANGKYARKQSNYGSRNEFTRKEIDRFINVIQECLED